MLIALLVGVGVSIGLVAIDGSFLNFWQKWSVSNHWFVSIARVGLYGCAISTFYLVRRHKIQYKESSVALNERALLRARIGQLILWFACFEILFGQAVLPRILELLFT
ncbi:MAG: hypothetical protein F4Z01_07870 [Gammaproteobacteria bacterium]|nr:hypothetical protein [Gammaproteobacteria bacterium]